MFVLTPEASEEAILFQTGILLAFLVILRSNVPLYTLELPVRSNLPDFLIIKVIVNHYLP